LTALTLPHGKPHWQRLPSWCFLESPSNPVLELVDIAAVCDLAHDAGALVLVDNVFASPLYQKPLELGADIVIYSTTKHIDGQGRLLGGAVLGKASFVEDVFLPFYRQTGRCH
jgi:O-succinylhomoserine sulfhydrylase